MTVAVLDACILYPPSLRDLLMRVASVGVYEPRLTDDIHDEWIRNVLKNNPEVTPAQLARTRRLMNQISAECLVSGYAARIPSINLPDPNDRHVLAAAIASGATLIVTFNLSDFPSSVLQSHGVRSVHPDRFLSALFDADSELFLSAVHQHRTSLRSPPKTAGEYLQTLRVNGLKELAQRIDVRSHEI